MLNMKLPLLTVEPQDTTRHTRHTNHRRCRCRCRLPVSPDPQFVLWYRFQVARTSGV